MEVDVKDKHKRTPLLLACAKGDLHIVRTLVDAGASAAMYDKNANGALHYAAARTTLDVADSPHVAYSGSSSNAATVVTQWLLDRLRPGAQKVNINHRNKKRDTPLLVAVRAGHVGAALSLLQAGADPSCVNLAGEDPLSIAAKRGYVEVLGAMLASNHRGSGGSNTRKAAPKEAGPVQKMCPLIEAVLSGNADSVSLLVLCGVSITETSVFYKRKTALMIACEEGEEDMTRLLLSAGSPQRTCINAIDMNGFTALFYACIAGNNSCIQQLVEHDPSCVTFCNRNRDGENVLEMLVRYTQQVSSELKIKPVQAIPTLMRCGCEVTPRFLRRVCGIQEPSSSLRPGSTSSTFSITESSMPVLIRSGIYLPISLQTSSYADVSIIAADGRRICCHGCVLAIHSARFRDIYTADSMNLDLPDRHISLESHSYEIIDAMVSWMYSGEVAAGFWSRDVQRVIDLLLLANESAVHRLQRLCEYNIWKILPTVQSADSTLALLVHVIEVLKLDYLRVQIKSRGAISVATLQAIQKHKRGPSTAAKVSFTGISQRVQTNVAECSPVTIDDIIEFDFMGCGKFVQSSDSLFIQRVLFHRLKEIGLSKKEFSNHLSIVKQCLKSLTSPDYHISSVLVYLLDFWRGARVLILANETENTARLRAVLGRLFTVLHSCFSSSMHFVQWVYTFKCTDCDYFEIIEPGGERVQWATMHDLISDGMYSAMLPHLLLCDMLKPTCDITIVCGNGSYSVSAHRTVLAKASLKLESLIRLKCSQSDWAGFLHLDELTPERCDCIIGFLYTGHINWSSVVADRRTVDASSQLDYFDVVKSRLFDEACALLMLADEYLIPEMKNEAEAMLIETITPGNCHVAVSVASCIQATRLMKKSAAVFLTNYNSILDHHNSIVLRNCSLVDKEISVEILAQLSEICESALLSLMSQ
jgi:ankyrin repeat protein